MSSIQFSIQTGDPLQPRIDQRLPDTCILRICKDLAHTPHLVMMWLEREQPHIRWCTGQMPLRGLPDGTGQISVLFIEHGTMSYSRDPGLRADEHTHLLNRDFSLRRIAK